MCNSNGDNKNMERIVVCVDFRCVRVFCSFPVPHFPPYALAGHVWSLNVIEKERESVCVCVCVCV